MEITLSQKPKTKSKVVFLSKEQAETIAKKPKTAAERQLAPLLKDNEPKQSIVITDGSSQRYVVILEEEKDITKESIRRAAAIALKRIEEYKCQNADIEVPDLKNLSTEDRVTGIAEGFLLADYRFNKYKSRKKDTIKEINILTGKEHTAKLEAIKTAIANTNLVRNLVNENADIMYPEMLANVAKDIAKKLSLKITVFDEKMLKKLGMGLLCAVGQGAAHPPRLIILEYRGNKAGRQATALIGKGITFDTGGINIKPTGYIETMKCDMAGAATVLGAIKTLAELKAKANVIAVMACAENAIDARSYKPGDVFTGYAKKSVEINNTDAEGRLVLADALAYTEKVLKPAQIIDLATLTGACIVALGEYAAGLISDNDRLANTLVTAGNNVHERVWRLPLYKEYTEELDSDIADMKNTGSKYAGEITAAAFLKKFIEKTPWAHIDIAGTAWASEKRNYVPKMATGFGVRLLVEALTGE